MLNTVRRLVFVSVFCMPTMAAASFVDVPTNHPNYDAISYLETNHSIQGYTDGTFRPSQTINRAEFVKILVANLYKDQPFYINACHGTFFPDIPQDAWYISYACRATDDHFVGGYPDGTFRPMNPINFSEAAKIISVVLIISVSVCHKN